MGGRDELLARGPHASPERGSFPADWQENRAILGELGRRAKTNFLIREEFDGPRWELVPWHTKGQVSF